MTKPDYKEWSQPGCMYNLEKSVNCYGYFSFLWFHWKGILPVLLRLKFCNQTHQCLLLGKKIKKSLAELRTKLTWRKKISALVQMKLSRAGQQILWRYWCLHCVKKKMTNRVCPSSVRASLWSSGGLILCMGYHI